VRARHQAPCPALAAHIPVDCRNAHLEANGSISKDPPPRWYASTIRGLNSMGRGDGMAAVRSPLRDQRNRVVLQQRHGRSFYSRLQRAPPTQRLASYYPHTATGGPPVTVDEDLFQRAKSNAKQFIWDSTPATT
jgi:hypothetical protein